jgi:hypothetical protein
LSVHVWKLLEGGGILYRGQFSRHKNSFAKISSRLALKKNQGSNSSSQQITNLQLFLLRRLFS